MFLDAEALLSGLVIADNSIVATNSTVGGGLAIFREVEGSNLIVSGNSVSGGSYNQGGGLYVYGSSTIATFTNVDVVGNQADEGGGLFNEWYSKLYLTNANVVSNSATTGSAYYQGRNTRADELSHSNFYDNGSSAFYGISNPSGSDGNIARSTPPDAVVLDLDVPVIHGFELLHEWAGRAAFPVVVVTAHTELESRLRAFELGAVDFVSKPFFLQELVARLRVQLQHPQVVARRRIHAGALEADLDARRAWVEGAELELTSTEFNLLACLLKRPDQPTSRSWLAEVAMGETEDGADRLVDPHISRLRRKLGAASDLIQTVWGIGYRFVPPS